MRPNREYRRILITRTDRLGDLVLSTPIFSAIRKKFPDAWITCLTAIENRAVVEGNLYLDEVILYDKKGREKNWFGNILLARKLASKKFDAVIHLHATNRMHFLTWLAGIPERVGWSRRLPWTLTKAYPDIKKEGVRHEAEYNFHLLQFLEISAPSILQTFFPVHEKAQLSLERLLDEEKVSSQKPWIVLNPSASCPSKRWPAGYFASLIEKIHAHSESEIFVIGTRSDRTIANQIRQASTIPFHDLTGRLSLSGLAELLRKSQLLISNDSGPVHMACAVGTPVVSIFGRKQDGLSSKRWGPLGEKSKVVWKDVGCTQCLAHQCQIQFLCLDAISADEVFQAAQDLQPGIFNTQVTV